LIVAAEAVAFLMVASVEIAIARDRRRYLQFPASPPTFTSLPAQEAGKVSEPLSVTLDQVEPLIWQAGRHEDAFETIWPLAPLASPSEPDDTEDLAEVEESATEISTPTQPESAAETTVAEAEAGTEAEPELEAEILAPESEPEQRRHIHLFRHEAHEPVSEAEAETEPEPETEAEVVLEGTAELPAPEREPEAHGRFHLFGRAEKTPEVEAALEAEIEPEAEAEAEVEAEPEPEYEPAPEILAPESEPEQRRRIHLFRHEAHEPIAEPEPETEVPDNKEAPLEIAGWRIRAGEPDSSTGDRDATIEIDLPPEISIAQIERTLEELGRREPGLRRRLWQRGAAENDAAARSANEEALDGESELCLTAELERRRREREY
jgi:pilus assembly protein FimV